MQVKSNPIPEKQTVLERQVRSKEIPAPNSTSIQSPKIEEHGSDKGAAQNETSQYLKVLSRVENLLIQDKLPDAAIEGFAGAVKNQIDVMTDEERQMLMKLPELKMLELDDLDDVPEMIKNDIRNEDKSTALLKFLRLPEFANLMRADNRPAPKTYTANSVSQPSTAKHEGKILSESAPVLAKTVQPSSAKATQKISQKVNPPFTNTAI
ncbi:MAG: hypothetical protein QGI65_02365 [SAR324 cluster bacterium]|jgi:hypothetical protein|nr:hypothetical protein [SAR324 cluster bacterium]